MAGLVEVTLEDKVGLAFDWDLGLVEEAEVGLGSSTKVGLGIADGVELERRRLVEVGGGIGTMAFEQSRLHCEAEGGAGPAVARLIWTWKKGMKCPLCVASVWDYSFPLASSAVRQ